MFLPFLRNQIFHSSDFQPLSTTELVQTRSDLKETMRVHGLFERWYVNLVPVFIIQLANHAIIYSFVSNFF